MDKVAITILDKTEGDFLAYRLYMLMWKLLNCRQDIVTEADVESYNGLRKSS